MTIDPNILNQPVTMTLGGHLMLFAFGALFGLALSGFINSLYNLMSIARDHKGRNL